ncbi:MAG: hypothetical protein IT200_00015 [Thermoleophilia bacterium]|nr:hypothetical protein [Thermoleophilia bacterium]
MNATTTYSGGGMRRYGDPPRKPGRCELCRHVEAPAGDHLCVACRTRLTEALLVYLQIIEDRREDVVTERATVRRSSRRGERMYSRA